MKGVLKLILPLIGAIYLLVTININFGKNKWQDVLESDAWGYYAYLPAVFIYHDLNFNFYEKVVDGGYFESRLKYEYRIFKNGNYGNKYFCGTAICVAPFFIGAHFISKVQHLPLDGYNRMYILSVCMAAIFYVLLGLYFLKRLLQFYTQKPEVLITVMLAVAFGTQVFYYGIGEPGMSHVYSFCFVNLFLWKMKSYLQSFNMQPLFWAAFALGVIFLIRPFNGLIVFAIPLLATSWNVFKNGFLNLFQHKLKLIGIVLLFLAIASVQSLIYYLQMGLFWVDSYPGESFDFSNPHIFKLLFSFKKGLFVYTPLFLLAHLALYKQFKHNAWFFYTYIGFFIFLAYIMSSWWIWYYGGGFSLRTYIDYFGVFSILLTMLLNDSKYKKVMFSSVFLLIVWCQIQTYQYRYFVIHWSEMNKEKYFDSVKQIFKL